MNKNSCNFIKKGLICLFLLVFTSCNYDNSIIDNQENLSSTENIIVEEDISVPIKKNEAELFLEQLSVGWNLGNTLDSCDFRRKDADKEIIDDKPAWEFYETYWGNPVTTEENIKMVSEAGFKTIRIPVTYHNHLSEDFTIRESWLVRVKEIVDYAMKYDMYCIINLHHDAGENTWLSADIENKEILNEKFKKVWTQIGTYFQDYDNKLIFEGFNELLDIDNNWTNVNLGAYEMTNILNQTFIDTIRNLGGHNSKRFLIVTPYAAGTQQETIDNFILPKDTIDNHILVGMHTYEPAGFSWTEKELDGRKSYTDWNDTRAHKHIDPIFQRINERFIKNGIPVLITEFATWDKGNVADRTKYAEYFVKKATDYGIVCLWWDQGGVYKDEEFKTNALLDRKNNTWYFPEIVEVLIQSAQNNSKGG